MRDFLIFYAGATIGSIIGVTVMCLLQINRMDDIDRYLHEAEPLARAPTHENKKQTEDRS